MASQPRWHVPCPPSFSFFRMVCSSQEWRWSWKKISCGPSSSKPSVLCGSFAMKPSTAALSHLSSMLSWSSLTDAAISFAPHQVGFPLLIRFWGPWVGEISLHLSSPSASISPPHLGSSLFSWPAPGSPVVFPGVRSRSSVSVSGFLVNQQSARSRASKSVS